MGSCGETPSLRRPPYYRRLQYLSPRTMVVLPQWGGVSEAKMEPKADETTETTTETTTPDVSPNGERLDAPGVEVVTDEETGAVFESVRGERTTLEVWRNSLMDRVHITTAHCVMTIRRADLQRLLPALTLYANTGSMVAAEGAAGPERHDEGHVLLPVNVHECARCGLDHTGLPFRRMTRPMEADDGLDWTHWALCPTSLDPILMRIEPDPPASDGAPNGGNGCNGGVS